MATFTEPGRTSYHPWPLSRGHVEDQCPPDLVLRSQNNGSEHPISFVTRQPQGMHVQLPYLMDACHDPSFAYNGTSGHGFHMTAYQHSMKSPFSTPSMDGHSSYLESNWSDEGTGWSSPDMHNPVMIPVSGAGERPYYQQGCVALHDLQTYTDANTYNRLEYEHGPLAHDSPMQDAPASFNLGEEVVYEQHGPAEQPSLTRQRSLTPNIRRRRTSGKTPSNSSSKKVTKRRPTTSLRSASYQGTPSSRSSTSEATTTTALKEHRHFACPLALYGCPSTFSSKNEWKRHCHSQHMRLGYWRCDLCPSSNPKPNDFNRKDLFYQHIRRMHPFSESCPPTITKDEEPSPSNSHSRKSSTSSSTTCKKQSTTTSSAEESYLVTTSTRCYRRLRDPPQLCCCILCEQKFSGARAWEDRLEHIGRHHEVDKKNGREVVEARFWREDVETEKWLIGEGLVVWEGDDEGGQWVLRGN